MAESHSGHCMAWSVSSQPLVVDFTAGALVEDAGLLAVRQLDVGLGVVSGLAARLPDPRAPRYVQHRLEALLVQLVYQFLAGYPDGNDAGHTRNDALFQLLAGIAPAAGLALASTATLNRFLYGYTRRDARMPREERPSLLQQRRAQVGRLRACNDFLVELFVRTRRQAPAQVVLDLDATDDPVHGKQPLAGYHGYYRQHQYLPLLIFEGHSGFPLACWLRPGTMHAACGARDVLQGLVERLRQAWPGVDVRVRGDCGYSVPALLDYCDEAQLGYAFGYAQNAVLQRRSAHWLAEVELVHRHYGYRDPHVQRYEQITDYQAQSWPRPRRVVVKVEATPQGSQRRFVVTNLSEPERQLYRGFYAQRGGVPEQPIGELKNGLRADRLSSSGFCANALKLLVAVAAYALAVLYREACAAVAGVANADVQTLRGRLWKVPAEVRQEARRVRVSLPGSWAERAVWQQTLQVVGQYAGSLPQLGEPPGPPGPPPQAS
jgi:Transposase DDE domain group 1